ncbi:MAG TPA: hypothetical protein VKO66_06035 [Sideroxyarcus sp.]|nr:hypothetical protein [Sideroxyarcus sp.]
MKTFTICGRYVAAPPPADWREQLARMLGAKPRRMGAWAELGLYGALSCMVDAGEKSLPQDAQIWLGSRRGTYAATGVVLEQLRDDLPMPLAFLQTQPSQLLALLAAQMEWTGHACFVAGSEPQALMRLAGAQAGKGGALLGWVDEMAEGTSNWLRLRPCEDAGGDYCEASAATLFSPHTSHLRLAGAVLEARI